MYHADNNRWPDDSDFSHGPNGIGRFIEVPVICPGEGEYEFTASDDGIQLQCSVSVHNY